MNKVPSHFVVERQRPQLVQGWYTWLPIYGHYRWFRLDGNSRRRALAKIILLRLGFSVYIDPDISAFGP
jgi:hypothetical protein